MATLVGTVLLAVCCFAVVVGSKSDSGMRSRILNLLSTNYSRIDPPSVAFGKPTRVKVGMYINSMTVDEQQSKFSATMYFRQSWADPRLATSRSGTKQAKQTDLVGDDLKKIWLPDTFIRSALSVETHDSPSDHILCRINGEGRTWYVTKLSTVLSSSMNFKHFPHDTQTLQMHIESFSHTMDSIILEILDVPIDVSHDIDLPQFEITRQETHDCSQNYTIGAYPCLEFSITIRRNSGYYILAVYIPSILFVILSWFVFWIDRDSSSIRLLTGALLLIILSLIALLTRSPAPHVSYITCLDVWFIVCHIFVFATLLEYFAVLVLSRMSSGLKGLKIYSTLTNDKMNAEQVDDHGNGKRKALMLDWVSRILFPAAFLIFNLIYWISVARQ